MTEMRRGILIAISIAAVPAALLAYGPTGHEIVGGIADKLVVNTPAGEKICTLTDGITWERASVIADEIKAWDKNGVDDPNAFPHYPEHAKIEKQLRDFWRGNPRRRIRSPMLHLISGFTTPMCLFLISKNIPTEKPAAVNGTSST